MAGFWLFWYTGFPESIRMRPFKLCMMMAARKLFGSRTSFSDLGSSLRQLGRMKWRIKFLDFLVTICRCNHGHNVWRNFRLNWKENDDPFSASAENLNVDISQLLFKQDLWNYMMTRSPLLSFTQSYKVWWPLFIFRVTGEFETSIVFHILIRSWLMSCFFAPHPPPIPIFFFFNQIFVCH